MGESKDKLESERINRNPQDKLETDCSYCSLHLSLTMWWPVYKAGMFYLKVFVFVPGPGLREIQNIWWEVKELQMHRAAAGHQPSVSVDQLLCV